MKTCLRPAVLVILAGLLAGCGHKTLKAPCAPDEAGTPLAFAESTTPHMPAAFAGLDPCGPMKPI
ncbi:hypothetical protein IED13_25950 [Bosea sp. SSUT16]|uniref:Lipoprotein n=1 Tax=Bosea spartocytisi TaxID=2773451 RepID=A0A927EE05_9HYPH|nr:hypothetical protein [Bosea spartocytisi]